MRTIPVFILFFLSFTLHFKTQTSAQQTAPPPTEQQPQQVQPEKKTAEEEFNDAMMIMGLKSGTIDVEIEPGDTSKLTYV